MNLGIQGRTALVTGAGRGLGRGICTTLASEGARIIAVSRTQADLDSLLAELPGEVGVHNAFAIDLEKPEGPSELIARIRAASLSPDIIVNNVGGNLGYTNPLEGLDGWRRVMHLNVEVSIELNCAFIPAMQAAKWGRIVHVSSIAALENQGPPSYCAAKAALNAYVRSLGRYVSPDNVVLTTVMPGAVFTPGGYWDQAQQTRPEHVSKYLSERMAIKRFGRIEEISGLVAFLCSEHASFCIGSCFLADGGQGRVFQPTDT